MNLSRFTRMTSTTIAMAVILYFLAAGYMYAFQRDFVFRPTGTLKTPEESGLSGVIAEEMTMNDGTNVTVWRSEPTKEGAPTVLYFHGNSGNITTRAARYKQIVDSGMGLYAPSYRGYAGSEGSPSEAAFVDDALEHFDRAHEDQESIVIHGESLGTGVATAVAAKRDAQALILEAPYTATVDIAAETYPWLPVTLLMKDQFLTRDRIVDVEEPVLILHGTNDHIIPFENGEKLYGIANDPKQLEVFDGAGHGDLWTRGLWEKTQAFLADHT